VQALESHLKALEGRADRRERELRAVVEDVKATSRLEHARLQALHVQQISDKDQQLARFQSDLERLVGALKQWQATAAASKPTHPIQETALVDNEINYFHQYGSHGIPAPGIRYM
jgi:predicted translin family RNA/ssDNA-binding protein